MNLNCSIFGSLARGCTKEAIKYKSSLIKDCLYIIYIYIYSWLSERRMPPIFAYPPNRLSIRRKAILTDKCIWNGFVNKWVKWTRGVVVLMVFVMEVFVTEVFVWRIYRNYIVMVFAAEVRAWVSDLRCHNYQRKFRNLTFDYTESCCWRSFNQQMWSRRCDTAEMCDMRIWRVGIARNVVFFHSFVASLAVKSASKNRSCEGSAAQDVAKICTTPARESDLEVKIAKKWRRQSTFGSWSPQNLHQTCTREGFGSQNRQKLTGSEHFRKFKWPKFAPSLRTRRIRKSKPSKTDGLGALSEV